MTAILEIPEVRQRVSPLSVEEYHRLDEFNENGRRTELIRGIVDLWEFIGASLLQGWFKLLGGPGREVVLHDQARASVPAQ